MLANGDIKLIKLQWWGAGEVIHTDWYITFGVLLLNLGGIYLMFNLQNVIPDFLPLLLPVIKAITS